MMSHAPGAPGRRNRDVLIIVPQVESAVRELQRHLESLGGTVDIWCSDLPNVLSERRSAVDLLWYYWLNPVLTMLQLARRTWRYGLVINYYHRNGYWLGLLGRLFRRLSGTRLAWVGVAPNPLSAGLKAWIKETITGSALQGYDLIVTNARPSVDAIKRRYPAAGDRVVYVRWGGTGDQDVMTSSDQGYIFSGGRTNRDFTTLFKALAAVDCPAVVVAGKDVAAPPGLPERIALRHDLPVEEFQRLLHGARIVVVALKHPEVSSGQVVLNRAMRSGKPVVVTNVAGMDDYVTDGKDAMLVAPGDAEDLRATLEWLLAHPERREEIGAAARETYESRFNSRVYAAEVFAALTGQVAIPV
jgi:glycosyltransferase involved in cell wall biosynthesis